MDPKIAVTWCGVFEILTWVLCFHGEGESQKTSEVQRHALAVNIRGLRTAYMNCQWTMVSSIQVGHVRLESRTPEPVQEKQKPQTVVQDGSV